MKVFKGTVTIFHCNLIFPQRQEIKLLTYKLHENVFRICNGFHHCFIVLLCNTKLAVINKPSKDISIPDKITLLIYIRNIKYI